MVLVQEAAWLPVISTNVPNSIGSIEPFSMAQRQGNLGQSHLLDRDIHWPQSPVQSVLDHMTFPSLKLAVMALTEGSERDKERYTPVEIGKFETQSGIQGLALCTAGYVCRVSFKLYDNSFDGRL